jgi:hypothetical protein
MPSISVFRFVVLLLQLIVQPSSSSVILLVGLPLAGAVCPNCHESFSSCDFDTSGTCAGVTAVASNMASITAGYGMLTIHTVIFYVET